MELNTEKYELHDYQEVFSVSAVKQDVRQISYKLGSISPISREHELHIQDCLDKLEELKKDLITAYKWRKNIKESITSQSSKPAKTS